MKQREIRGHEAVGLDFTQVALKLGAAGPNALGRWTPLTQEDFQVLYMLLTKRFDGVAATDESEALQLLASFSAAAIQWFRRQDESKAA